MGMMEKMMGLMMARMSQEEKDEMMGTMMDKFFADMTPEDKQNMMAAMMPKMMEGMNMMEMMPKMMMGMMGGGEGCPLGEMSEMTGGGKEAGTPMMANMMTQMMPHCLTMMLPTLPKEQRTDFVLKVVAILTEQGSAGMSDQEKKDFVEKVVETAKA